jgi:DNA primase
MLSERIKNLDAVSIINENSGVQLRKVGARHVGPCSFHEDRTPSFYVFPDGHYKCFGCGEHGDVVDFVQKLHGLSFKDALRHLGIEQGRVTPEIRRSIEQRKRKAELLRKFREWEIQYCIYISDFLFRTKKLMMNGIPPDDLDLYATLFHKMPVWQHHIDVLISRDDQAKFKLYIDKEEAHEKGSRLRD